MKFELQPHHRNVSDEELIVDVMHVAQELEKRSVTIDEYNERGRFHSSTLTRRFGSWFTVLQKAGLEKTRNLNISNEELFDNLVEVWLRLGRQPKYNDLTKDISKYVAGTYEYRFGRWRVALESFVKWANEGKMSAPPERSAIQPRRRTPRNINWRLRALVLIRDGAHCHLCGSGPTDGAKLHVDHIRPWSKGGETVLENLQILCEVCNVGKSNVENVDDKKDKM
jgi:5-methylcytosine-specific restriction endonuclease McrA